MVNQGQYVALVDQNTCQTSSGNTSSSNLVTNTPNMMRFIVEATQQNSQPITVKMWAVMPPDNNSSGSSGNPFSVLIKATMNITAGKTNTNPYGIFSMNFVGFIIESNGGIGQQGMKGYIISSNNSDGSGNLKFYQQEQSHINIVNMNSTGNNIGYAKVQASRDDSSGSNFYAVAFNNQLSYVDPSDSINNICYDRNNYKNLVYSYGVYDNNGNRVNLNSGYPAIYKNMQTWIGYFGLNVPPGVTVNDGDPITLTEGNNTQLTGSLFVRSGKMQQMTAKLISLENLAGTQFNVSTATSSTNDILTWNKELQVFEKIGTQICNSNGCNQSMQTPEILGQVELVSYANARGGDGCNPNMSLWINGLGSGGSTQVSIGNTTSDSGNNCQFTFLAPTNSTILKVWVNSPVNPSNDNQLTTLYCISNCPMDSNGNVISPEFSLNGDTDNGHLQSYVFDRHNYLLKVGSSQTVINPTADNVVIFSGPLLTESEVVALQESAYSYDGHAHSYAIFSSDVVDSYYNFSASGSNQPWNHFIGVQVNGNLLTFTPPLQLSYTNESGGNIFLQYFGFGNLQGIPGVCQNTQGDVVECGNSSPDNFTMWVPAYNIPSGSQLVDANNTNNTYWLKQLMVGQQMGLGNSCSTELSVEIDKANQLPLDTDGALWNNPDTIGDMPNITTPPIFINGVHQ